MVVLMARLHEGMTVRSPVMKAWGEVDGEAKGGSLLPPQQETRRGLMEAQLSKAPRWRLEVKSRAVKGAVCYPLSG